VLWHVEVEGRRIPEVARLLRTSPAAVSSLAYRAREGLKLAYLDRRLGVPPPDRRCQWVQDRRPPAADPEAEARTDPGCFADTSTVRHELTGAAAYSLLPGQDWVICEYGYDGTAPGHRDAQQ
jgi:hypothetical protein